MNYVNGGQTLGQFTWQAPTVWSIAMELAIVPAVNQGAVASKPRPALGTAAVTCKLSNAITTVHSRTKRNAAPATLQSLTRRRCAAECSVSSAPINGRLFFVTRQAPDSAPLARGQVHTAAAVKWSLWQTLAATLKLTSRSGTCETSFARQTGVFRWSTNVCARAADGAFFAVVQP
jgi:hypothetical protein